MIRWAIKDYFGSFRWERIKEQYRKGGWWIYIYFMTVLPLIMQLYERNGQGMVYTLICAPIMFCMFAASLHQIALPKIMYLCPASWKKRKAYIVASVIMHIGFPILIGMSSAVILLVLGLCDGLTVLVSVVNMIGLAFAMGTATGIRMVQNSTGWEGYNKATTDGGAVEMVALIVDLLLAPITVWMMDWYVSTFAMVIKGSGVIVSIVVHGLVLFKYCRNWRGFIENTVHYESAIK